MAWFDDLKVDGASLGKWIWPAEGARLRSETALFRGAVEIPDGAVTLLLHTSASGGARYTLWLNEQAEALARGPARGDHRRSVDVSAVDLRGHRDLTLWAQVRWWAGPPEAALADAAGSGSPPGFYAALVFLNDAGEIIAKRGTGDGSWTAALCPGLTGEAINGVPGYVCIGEAERHASAGFPAGWRAAEVREPWAPASLVGEPYFEGDPAMATGPWSAHGWLVERAIPPMHEEPGIIRELVRVHADRLEPVDSFSAARPGETVTWRADVGEQINAYLRPTVRGRGTVRITTGEVLVKDGVKYFSLASAGPGARLHPLTDTFTHDGAAERHTFETAHWRAFRFLEIQLTADGDAGAEIVSLELAATGYPLETNFEFHADETAEKIADISWRTLRRCAWETYMDCPYYEQLQYIGDTRIQCLLTYVTTGDLTLPAQALRAFDRSRTMGGLEGLTQSRYPCPPAMAQTIPPFSLIYILMIEDYLRHAGDAGLDLVAELRPGIAPILNWFTRYLDLDTGLLGETPQWSFVDWVNGWPLGVPPQPEGAASAPLNLLYLLALQSAMRIYERAKPGSGNFYATRATAMKQRVYDAFFDAGRGLVCDVPVEIGRGRIGVWSQHAQALAVLTGILPPSEARAALVAATAEKNLLRAEEAVGDRAAAEAGRFIAPASLYFRFYVAEALAALRMGEGVWNLLGPFREAIARGSTTWPESLESPPPAPGCRSECHAWSAWPLYFFARHLLGIAPPAVDAEGGGDGRTRVRPLECPPLGAVKGRFMGPRGPVDVAVTWESGVAQVTASGAGVEVVRGA